MLGHKRLPRGGDLLIYLRGDRSRIGADVGGSSLVKDKISENSISLSIFGTQRTFGLILGAKVDREFDYGALGADDRRISLTARLNDCRNWNECTSHRDDREEHILQRGRHTHLAVETNTQEARVGHFVKGDDGVEDILRKDPWRAVGPRTRQAGHRILGLDS